MPAAPAALALGLALALAPAAGVGVEAPELRFDPFARPDLSGTEAAAPGAPGAGFAPVLRGTLVAGENSLANLGGFVLRIGEEAQGWKLVEVGPFQATFEREGQRVVLDVDGEASR